MKKGIIFLVLIISFVSTVAQTTNDYRSNGTSVTVNLDASTNWQRWNGSAWVAATAAPIGVVGSGNTITILSGHTYAGSTTAVNVVSGVTVLHQGTTAATMSAGVVTFDNGSTFVMNSASSAARILGVSTLSSNSTWEYRGYSSLQTSTSFAGRTYGNVLFTSTSGTWTVTQITGATACIINGNLTVNPNVNASIGLTSTPGHSIKGNISVSSGASLTFNPASAGTLNFNGTSAQTISNSGTLNFSNTNQNIVIGNSVGVTINSAVTFGGTLTVSSGALLATYATMTANGATTINGTFQINQGAWATGSGTWTYASTGTLVFNNSSGSYGVNADVFWPATSGPYNVTVQNGGGITMNVSRTVPTTGTSGSFKIISGSVAGSTLTLNGTTQIDGGSFSTSPIYGSSSLLKYNTGGTYGRSNEWSAVGIGTIGTTAGYPNNVQISNSTTLNLPNGSNNAKACARDLTIDAGSSLYADYSGGSVNLTVVRDLIFAGNISLGSSVGGDLTVGRNWTHTTGTFNPNSRAVYFNGSTGQTITASSSETFAYLFDQNTSGTSLNVACNIVINNQLDIASTSTFDMTTYDLSGAFTTSGSATGILKTSSISTTPMPSGKSWAFNVRYVAAADQTVVTGTYSSLTFTSAGNKKAAGDIICNGVLTVNAASTFDMDTYQITGSSFSTSATGIFKTQNTSAAPFPSTSTVTFQTNYYNPTGGQTVVAATYSASLTVSNTSGTQTANGNIIVNGTLTTTAGGTLDLSTNTLSGTLTTINNNGTIKTSNTSATPISTGKTWGGTIEYAVTIGGQTIVDGTYNNLSVDNTSGTNTIGGATTVNGILATASGGKTSISGNTLTLNGTITGSGELTGSALSNLSIGGTGALGTINFDQTTDGITNTLNNFILNRTSGGTATLGNKLVLIDNLTPTAGTLNTGGYLNLRSRSTNTARINQGSSSGGYISGDVTVERWMSSANSGTSNRAYRLITPTVTTTNYIRDNWQEGTNNPNISTNNNPVAKYGTHITGSNGNTGGFDVTQTNATSLFTYSGGNWVAVANTNATTLDAKTGYLIFIRGSRDNIATINTATGYTDSLILRAKGTIKQGDQTFATTGVTGDFALVTNPFAAPISWASVYTTNAANYANYVTVWDPNQGSRGGYVTVRNDNVITPSSNLTTNIQSGEAFFVQLNATNPTLSVNEAHKSTTNNLDVYRNTTSNPERINISLKYTVSGVNRNADGVTLLINNSYDNAVDGNDAEQIQNWDEDVAILRDGKELSIESRSNNLINDTLYLQTLRLKSSHGSYRWEIEPLNISTITNAFLIDNFAGTTTPLSLSSTTIINFSVTTNPSSQAADRFKIVFTTNGALPVTLTNFNAELKDAVVILKWNVANEINVVDYSVERSDDGSSFKTITTIKATGSNSYTVNDEKIFDKAVYYRLRINEQSGKYNYSSIVKVQNGNYKPSVAVYPNPVTNGFVNVQFVNMESALYNINVYNSAGQTIYQKQIIHNGGSSTQKIEFSDKLLKGVNKLTISNSNGFSNVITLINP